MKIGKTDFSNEALAEIRELTYDEALAKYPSVHPKVIAKIQEGKTVAKPKKAEKKKD